MRAPEHLTHTPSDSSLIMEVPGVNAGHNSPLHDNNVSLYTMPVPKPAPLTHITERKREREENAILAVAVGAISIRLPAPLQSQTHTHTHLYSKQAGKVNRTQWAFRKLK